MSNGVFWSSVWNYCNGASASSGMSKEKIRAHLAIRVALCALGWWVAPAQAAVQMTPLPDESTRSAHQEDWNFIWFGILASPRRRPPSNRLWKQRRAFTPRCIQMLKLSTSR